MTDTIVLLEPQIIYAQFFQMCWRNFRNFDRYRSQLTVIALPPASSKKNGLMILSEYILYHATTFSSNYSLSWVRQEFSKFTMKQFIVCIFHFKDMMKPFLSSVAVSSSVTKFQSGGYCCTISYTISMFQTSVFLFACYYYLVSQPLQLCLTP